MRRFLYIFSKLFSFQIFNILGGTKVYAKCLKLVIMAKGKMLTAIEKAQIVKLLGKKKVYIRNFSNCTEIIEQ